MRRGGRSNNCLIVATLEFLFDLDWFIQHEKRLEDHFFHSIFTCFVAFGRTCNPVRANDMAVLSYEHFHLHGEMLGPQRGRPFEKDRLMDRVQTDIPNPITEWANRVRRRYEVCVIKVRN